MKLKIDHFLMLLASGLEADACIDFFSPFYNDQPRQVAGGAAAVWIYALTTAKSNPHQARLEIHSRLQGFLHGLAVERQRRIELDVPSRRTVNRSLTLPTDTNIDGDEARDLDSIARITEALTRRQRSLCEAVIGKGDWVPGSFYVTIDGRLMPFWGIGSNLTSTDKGFVHRLSSTGRFTCGAIRSKKLQFDDKKVTKGVPKWEGTVRGHHWLHLTLHNLNTKESIPLVTSFRYGTKAEQLKRALKALEALPAPPVAVLFDKEFTHGYDGLRILREYADRRGVYTIGPLQGGGQRKQRMNEAWTGRKFIDEDQEGNQLPESLWINWEEHVPNKHDAHWELYAYTLDNLRPDLQFLVDRDSVAETKDGHPIIGITFYSNIKPTLETVHWMATIYARRWACESMFMRHATRMGISQSRLMPTKHFGYVAAFAVLGVYGVWRTIHRKRLQKQGCTKMYPKELSHTVFFGRVKGRIEWLFAEAFIRDALM